MDSRVNNKYSLKTIAERNSTIQRIIQIILKEESFLLLGHELPDEDCISSLVSMALLLHKFNKKAYIFIPDHIPEQLSYLVNICNYNKIPVYKDTLPQESKPNVIFILDTPKPEMIAYNSEIKSLMEKSDIPIIEFDHHLSADAAFCGSENLRLVIHATSTCEIIAFFATKISFMTELLENAGVEQIFTRNIVLSMLTGIIGDTRFGLTLKTNRDIFFYQYFTTRFSKILRDSSHKNSSNYSSMQAIFKTMESLSIEEKTVFQSLLDHARYSGKTGYVVLDEEESANYLRKIEYSLFVKVIKSVTDFLAEKSGTYGLTSYHDLSEMSGLIQFRLRTSRETTETDLRTILTTLQITDGGGHPGAIGFRMPASELENRKEFISKVLQLLAKM